MLHDGDVDEVFIVKDVDEVRVVKTEAPGNVTIVTGRKLDDKTRQKVREALESAGDDVEVLFIDGSEIDGDDAKEHRKVRIVTKKVDVSN